MKNIKTFEKFTYLKTFESINQVDKINDIKDILIDINDEFDINLSDDNRLGNIRVIDWVSEAVVWDEDSEHTFIMLDNYLKENSEVHLVYLIREINGERSYREIMKYHEFLSSMNYGEKIVNLLIILK